MPHSVEHGRRAYLSMGPYRVVADIRSLMIFASPETGP